MQTEWRSAAKRRHAGGYRRLWRVLIVIAALVPAFLVDTVAPSVASEKLAGIIGNDDRFPERSDSLPWVAIGKVSWESSQWCTGVLVGSRMVLTAAHCVWNRRTRNWMPPQYIHFNAGLRGNNSTSHARVTEVRAAPGVEFNADGTTTRLVDDWALLVLDKNLGDQVGTVPLLSVPPSHAQEFANLRNEVASAGYNLDRPYLLYRVGGCNLTGSNKGGRILFHTCDSTQGTSGAPLLIKTGDRYNVIAVQVALMTTHGEKNGVAIIPAPRSAQKVQ